MNPGLKALWEDERERRAMLECPGPLTPPGSPPRPPAAHASTDSERFWFQRYDAMIIEKRLGKSVTDPFLKNKQIRKDPFSSAYQLFKKLRAS
jgi:hypothetical protein